MTREGTREEAVDAMVADYIERTGNGDHEQIRLAYLDYTAAFDAALAAGCLLPGMVEQRDEEALALVSALLDAVGWDADDPLYTRARAFILRGADDA